MTKHSSENGKNESSILSSLSVGVPYTSRRGDDIKLVQCWGAVHITQKWRTLCDAELLFRSAEHLYTATSLFKGKFLLSRETSVHLLSHSHNNISRNEDA